MVYTVGFAFYALCLTALLTGFFLNRKTKASGDNMEPYVAAMTDSLVKNARKTTLLATIYCVLLSLAPAGIAYLVQRFGIAGVSVLYIMSGNFYTIIITSFLSFFLAAEFLLRSTWKTYAVSALYTRRTAPPSYKSRRVFLIMQTVLFAVAFPFYIFALGNYTYFTQNAIVYSRYMSPKEMRYSYEQVKQTGTQNVADKYGNPDVIYTITFDDGNALSFPLSSYKENTVKMQQLIEQNTKK